jgi:hypothetical protein
VVEIWYDAAGERSQKLLMDGICSRVAFMVDMNLVISGVKSGKQVRAAFFLGSDGLV